MSHLAIREVLCRHVHLYSTTSRLIFTIEARYNKLTYIWLKYDLDRYTADPKFDLTGVQAHDVQIMNSTFYVPETLILNHWAIRDFYVWVYIKNNKK